ncbi:pyridoxal phosphate-dependent aminotransferase [Nocardia sp. NPDC003482]
MTRFVSDVAELSTRSEARKRSVREALPSAARFAGTAGRTYEGIIDAYHGETGLGPDSAAVRALDRAWSELLHTDPPPDYAGYDKRQPAVLRELAADRLFERFVRPADGVAGVRVRPEEVLVCPYSSTILLEEAVATLARPGGVIVCPEGFYKSAGLHVRKAGLRIVCCPATPDDRFAIDPEALADCLAHYRGTGELCGVLLTLPGNPVVARYSKAELLAVARVLAEAEVPVVCDMAFDRLVAAHLPLAALEVDTAAGPVRMYDRVLTLTGNSKGYNAFGPCKIGAACTGDADWLARIRARLTIAFQRETAHLARAVLEHTPDRYFEHNRKLMREQMSGALDRIDDLNRQAGRKVLRPLGSAEGMFLSVEFDAALLAAAGVDSAARLEDLLLVAAGIDSVALDRTGSPRLGVRLNVLAPRKAPRRESRDLADEMFDRLMRLVGELAGGLTYRAALVEYGLPELDSMPS